MSSYDEKDLVPGLSLEAIDRSGAIGEAMEDVYGHSRTAFLRKLAIGGGGLVAALAAPPLAEAKVNETGILNFGLVFEYLQATFYTETQRVGTVARMDARRARWAETLGAHERAHVKILQSVLGKKAVAKPFFDYGGITEDVEKFTRTAVAMEDLTVALLTGQLPRLQTRPLMAAFFTLLTVEARHAAWARRIVGVRPVAGPLDHPRTLAGVAEVVRRTHFIVSRPHISAKRRPSFTG